jgi:hypothetical protein
MTIAMDELDVAFLPATGAPLWQPLGGEASSQTGDATAADDGWTEILLQIELDRAWNEVAGMLAAGR